MQEAFGGIMNIIFIAVFLLLVEGILGFIVVYQRAFRVKNMVISSIEQYEGVKGCGLDSSASTSKDTACINRIIESAKSVGYSGKDDLTCPTNYTRHSSGIFCYRLSNTKSEKKVYNILVKLDIPFPIVNKIGFTFFQVSGDTRAIDTNY